MKPRIVGYPPGTKLRKEEGATLVVVMFVVVFLALGLGTYLNSLSGIRRIQEQRIADDRALLSAEAGLARAISQLTALGTPPSVDTTWTYNLPPADFAPFQDVSVTVYPRIVSNQQRWTLASTATLAAGASRYKPISRRVQATLVQQNFARYEYFVNDFGGVWIPGYFQFEGFGAAYLGPYHCNSGVAFWPNLWMLKETTVAASGGVNYFANFGSYMSVYGKTAANNAVNILNYFDPTFNKSPQFYGGLTVLPKPVSLPADMNVDVRAEQLRTNAGLKLPAAYAGYDATKGPNFAVELVSPTSNPADAKVEVKQIIGTAGDGTAIYGPTRSYFVSSFNNAMIVYGNIRSLKGVLTGKLTIAAMQTAELPNAGNIDITGSLEYSSRKADAGFAYTNDAQLYTPDGSGIQQSYVNTILGQLNHITDTLGLVAERDVMIKERDLAGVRVAADAAHPLYIDAIVMATGSSTGNTKDGGFGVENMLTRPVGTAYFLGGSIQNYGYSWALYSGSICTNGLKCNRLWDERAYKPGGAPPFFPSTGSMQFLGQSWRSGYVSNASQMPWLPN